MGHMDQQNYARKLADPASVPLEAIDVSDGEIFRAGLHHAYFRRLRAEDPVHWSPTGPTGGYWSITRYDDIMEIEKNPSVFSSDTNIVIGDVDEEFKPTMFIAKDAPVHTVQRKAAMPAVAKLRIAALEAQIRERTARLLDGLPKGEVFDWVDTVSIELTTAFLATLFDFPWEDRRLLTYWSDAAVASETVGNLDLSFEERKARLMECLAYFQRLWMERADAPPAFDFISLLAHNPDTKDMIHDPLDFLGNLMLLIVGGNDTTRNSMSGGIYWLNKFPDEFAKLKADPGLIPNMVSEIIRYQTPLAHMRRTATRDVTFRGRFIRKGDRVVMWYVSGNRDEAVIENADQFIIDRPKARQHSSFGFGVHRCMGNHAAELQLRILWEELLKRFDRIDVVGEPRIVASNFVMGYETLPVRLTPKR